MTRHVVSTSMGLVEGLLVRCGPASDDVIERIAHDVGRAPAATEAGALAEQDQRRLIQGHSLLLGDLPQAALELFGKVSNRQSIQHLASVVTPSTAGDGEAIDRQVHALEEARAAGAGGRGSARVIPALSLPSAPRTRRARTGRRA